MDYQISKQNFNLKQFIPTYRVHITRLKSYPLFLYAFLILFFLLTSPLSSYAVRCIDILRHNDPVGFINPDNCLKCHPSIYDSWRRSRHALSWNSETYIKASEKRSKEKCFPCHIPEAIIPGEKPLARIDLKHIGVYCIPCHMTTIKTNGPIDIFAPAPTEKDRYFKQPRFCGSCHKKTYEEWIKADVSETCQKCHMKPLGKTVDHSFPFIEIREYDIGVTAGIIDNEVRVSLKNSSIPHMFPTADNGDPRLYLYVILYNGAGEEIDKYKEILAPQQDTSLPFGEEVDFVYDWTKEVKRVEIQLKYKPAWTKNRAVVRRITL